MKFCFELHSEMYKPLPYNQFIQYFEMWLTMFAGKSIDEAIKYFKDNKIK